MASTTFDIISSAVSSVQGGITLVTAFVALLAMTYKLHHEQLRKFPLEHLKLLQEAAAGDDLIVQGVRQAAHLEVYRQTFRASGSPKKATYMFTLLGSGEFSLRELRAAAPYLREKDGSVAIRPGWFSMAQGLAYLAACVAILMLTASVVWSLFRIGTVTGALSALGAEVTGLLIAGLLIRLTSTEWAAHECARRAPAIVEGLSERSSMLPAVSPLREAPTAERLPEFRRIAAMEEAP